MILFFIVRGSKMMIYDELNYNPIIKSENVRLIPIKTDIYELEKEAID